MKGIFILYLLVAALFILPVGCTQIQLWEASVNGNTASVQDLLEEGADVNAKDKDGDTALILSAVSGDTASVQLLLTHGADVNAQNIYGYTALMYAEKKERVEIIEILKKAGAK